MPNTQAYSVSWTVDIAPEGDVSDDVAEITLIREDGVDSATVKLDTSKRPHALEEQNDITITIEDGNTTVDFTGFVDKVSDDDERPVVTIDARDTEGKLDDVTAVGDIEEDTLFDVIEQILDQSAGQIRGITYDPQPDKDEHGTFGGSTHFGSISVAHSGQFGVNSDTFTQMETASNGKEAELRIDNYENNTSNYYTLTIEGQDSDGNTVTATLELPPGSSVQDAFGTSSVKLALTGGNSQWTQVNSISTDIPNFSSGSNALVLMGADIFNYVKTSWNFTLNDQVSVREALNSVMAYLSGIDPDQDWEYYVDDSRALQVQPEQDATPTTHVFREGDNVTKPVADRDLDGVRNFIKVNGAGRIDGWFWAYGGDLQWSLDNPFETGEYPDAGVVYDSSPVNGQNDIDQIDLRGQVLDSDQISSIFQAVDIGEQALREFYATPVSGTAPQIGINNIEVGDKAEVYYPSRGIPAKVADNVYSVKKVEFGVTPESATTKTDFGTKRPNLADMIRNDGKVQRTDISSSIREYSDPSTSEGSAATGAIEIVAEGTEEIQDGQSVSIPTGVTDVEATLQVAVGLRNLAPLPNDGEVELWQLHSDGVDSNDGRVDYHLYYDRDPNEWFLFARNADLGIDLGITYKVFRVRS